MDKELAPLWEAGARFVNESELGFEVDPDGLFDAGFDAIVLSVGTGKSPERVLPGDEAALMGRDLLKRVRGGRAMKLRTPSVAVIGDGITALGRRPHGPAPGAKACSVIAPHRRRALPAGGRELAAALEEGVKFEFDRSPRRSRPRPARPKAWSACAS